MPVIQEQHSWLRRRMQRALVRGMSRAYETVKVNPDHFLVQLRTAYELPISNFQGVYSLEPAMLDDVATKIIRGSMKAAAFEGAGLGLGGIVTMVPDLSILAGITLRMVQKLSLLYGFEYNTEDEIADLWLAAASAAGVDVSRELLEKEVVSRFVPRIIRRIAVQASGEFVEKWSGRLIPIASSAIGAGLNYFFVRAWGARVRGHFRQRYMEKRGRLLPDREPRILKAEIQSL